MATLQVDLGDVLCGVETFQHVALIPPSSGHPAASHTPPQPLSSLSSCCKAHLGNTAASASSCPPDQSLQVAAGHGTGPVCMEGGTSTKTHHKEEITSHVELS